jgi:formamidopyrimidine-DNA glycosylase
MTGHLLWERSAEHRHPHTHLVFHIGGSTGEQPDPCELWLHYSDPRRFGKLRVLDSEASAIADLGPDPLEISWEAFYERLHARNAMVKALLLDQRFLRGLGNIYADESLARAGIHPAAVASRLSKRRAERLYHSIRETLSQAIELGGSSIANYLNAEGRAGWFQREHQVYQRTGQPCVQCGAAIRRMLIASRGTHFCPRCQRAGGRRRRSSGASRSRSGGAR